MSCLFYTWDFSLSQEAKREKLRNAGECFIMRKNCTGDSIMDFDFEFGPKESIEVYLSCLKSLGAAQADAQWARWKTVIP